MNNLLKKCIAIALAMAMIIGAMPVMPLHAFYDEALPRIVGATPSPATIQQGGTVEITVATENIPAGAWIDIHVTWREGLSIVGGPRFYINEYGIAVVTIAAAVDAPLGQDGFGLAARVEDQWGGAVIVDDIPLVMTVVAAGSGPYIRVITEFPSGEVDIPFVDITYVAVPSPGAVITEVFYTNNSAVTYIYISEASRYASTRGTFGEARVFITPQPNNQFVFHVRDSAGGEATYTVANMPTVNMGMFDRPPPQDLRYAERFNEYFFVQTDRFHIRAQEGVTPAQMAEFANYLGGSIIAQFPLTRSYDIGFPFNRTYAELQELREFLHAEYPHIVWRMSISYADDPDNTLFSGDVLWTGPGIPAGTLFTTSPPALPAQEVQAPHSFRTTCAICEGRGPTCDPFWGTSWPGTEPEWYYQYPLDWGFRHTNFPAAWQYFDNNQRTIRVGVLDSWFNPTLRNVPPDFERPRYWPDPHPSLSMEYANLRNLPRPWLDTTAQNHGNMVLALIASEHNTHSGLAGGVDLPRNAVFAHGVTSDAETMRNAMRWLIVQGSQVVNVSKNALGIHNAYIINDELAFLLSVGYDALIVQSAGNQGEIATSDNRIFSYRGIMDNVITVTASSRDGHMWEAPEETANWEGIIPSANWGLAAGEGLVPVNVAAPGQGIYTLNETGYVVTSGTSFAAPFVTSVAALAWKNNPALDARDIKNVIIQAAETMGVQVADYRYDRRDYYPQVNAFATVGLATVWDPTHRYSALVGYVGENQQDAFGFPVPLGEPIPNASVGLFEFGTLNFLGGATTCERGFFRLGNLSPGLYEMSVVGSGFLPYFRPIEIHTIGVSTEVVMFTLIHEGSGNVGGRFFRRSASASSLHEPLNALLSPLTDPTLEPILEAVTLTFRPARDANGRLLAYGQSEIVKTYTTNKGYFDITLPAGEYFVTATAEGFQPAMRTVTSNGGRSISGQDIFLQPHDFDKVITTVDQLLYVTTAIQNNSTINGVPAASARYRLAADLDLSNVQTFFGMGTHQNPFAGTFYGGGHSVRLNINPHLTDAWSYEFSEVAIPAMTEEFYVTPTTIWNLTYYTNRTGFVGLFRFTDGATISDVTVEGSVQGRTYVGGIVGNARNTTITNVENRASIRGLSRAYGLSPGIGGIAGVIEDSTVTNSINRSDVHSGRYGYRVGGIVGDARRSDIIGSTSIGDVTGHTRIGGLVGYAAFDSYISTSAVLGNISGGHQIGGVAGVAIQGTVITNVEVMPSSAIVGVGVWGLGGVVGGIVGFVLNSSITHSRMHGDATTSWPGWPHYYTGSIAGEALNSIITDNGVWGAVHGSHTGDIVGRALDSYIARNTVHQP